jgi:hypothetical protein
MSAEPTLEKRFERWDASHVRMFWWSGRGLKVSFSRWVDSYWYTYANTQKKFEVALYGSYSKDEILNNRAEILAKIKQSSDADDEQIAELSGYMDDFLYRYDRLYGID